MFESIINKSVNTDTEDLCLFINPSGNKNSAKYIYFSLQFDKKDNSIWEIYRNPIVSSNGTTVTALKLDGVYDQTNTIFLYRGPTVSSYGLPVRKFQLPANTQEFSTNAPVAELEAGQSLLLRRITKLSGRIINTWTWQEIIK